jgi:hypothetical protein
MWVSFKPVKNRDVVVRVAERIMRKNRVRIENVGGRWKLSLLIGRGGRECPGQAGQR